MFPFSLIRETYVYIIFDFIIFVVAENVVTYIHITNVFIFIGRRNISPLLSFDDLFGMQTLRV